MTPTEALARANHQVTWGMPDIDFTHADVEKAQRLLDALAATRDWTVE